METSIIVACIAAIGSMVVAIINGLMQRTKNKNDLLYRAEREKLDKERAAKDEQSREVFVSILEGLKTNMKALDITLISLQGGKLNGNVEEARRMIEQSAANMDKVKNEALSQLL